MLAKVKCPYGKEVSFEYDALGRRISKIGNRKITRYIWDGNILLHEWSYDVGEEPKTFVDDDGNVAVEKEKVENLITWVYDHTDQNELTPIVKLIGDRRYCIINDYLGTPIQAFEEGNLIWKRELDIYGHIKEEKGDLNFIPFQYQGQYYDQEVDLCYNRFRYYDQHSGLYISQDPISLMGGLSFYSYVNDINLLIDPFGLAPWPRGRFNEWFNNASVADIVKNKSAVSRALRNGGGMQEMFPVCLAPKLKALGFTAEDIIDASVPTKGLVFKDVPDPKTGELLTGAHHKSAASKIFHDNLIGDLSKAKTKIGAKRISKRHHIKHVKMKKSL